MDDQRDQIYKQPLHRIADFEFDEQVAQVFPDMINRSVPGYASIIRSLGLLTHEVVQANTCCYDLGCSLGASTLAMRQNMPFDNCRIIAVDNAPAMVRRCQQNIAADACTTPVSVLCEDIAHTTVDNASLVVLNFTLQFIDIEARTVLINKVYRGLHTGGVVLLSEKIAFDDRRIDQLQTALHHRFKRANGYSELETSQKRNALEKVLVPESLTAHRQRLLDAGFQHIEVWFQCFNFLSLLAIK